MRQASQSMHEESTKKSPGTLAGSLRATCATGSETSGHGAAIPRQRERVGMTAHPRYVLRRMFDNLQDKMDRAFKTLRGEASLNAWHIDNALKEIRVA